MPRFYSTFPSLMCLYAGGSWGVFGLKHLCFATASTTRATRLFTQSLCHSNTCRHLFLRAVPCDLRSAAARQRSHVHVHLRTILPFVKESKAASLRGKRGTAIWPISSSRLQLSASLATSSTSAAAPPAFLPDRPIRNAWTTLHHQTWARF